MRRRPVCLLTLALLLAAALSSLHATASAAQAPGPEGAAVPPGTR